MDAAWSPDGSTLAVRIDEWFNVALEWTVNQC